MALCTPTGGMGMVVRRRVRRTAVGDALCIRSGSGVEKGCVIGIGALGYRWCRVDSTRAGPRPLVEFAPCLSGLDLVQDAIAGVGGDALDLPLEAKLAMDEGDVVELVEGEGDRERGMSGKEMGKVGADAARGGDGVRVVVGWGRAGDGRELAAGGELGRDDGESGLDGLERGRAMARRAGHGENMKARLTKLHVSRPPARPPLRRPQRHPVLRCPPSPATRHMARQRQQGSLARP